MVSRINLKKGFKPVVFTKNDLRKLNELISHEFSIDSYVRYVVRTKNRVVDCDGIDDLFNEFLLEELPVKVTDLKIIVHERDSKGFKIIGSLYITMGFLLNQIVIDHENENKARGSLAVLRNFLEKRKAPYFLLNKIMNYSFLIAPVFSIFPWIFPEVLSFYWELVFNSIGSLLIIFGVINFKRRIFNTSKIYFVESIEKVYTFKDPQWLAVYIGIVSIIVMIGLNYL